MPNISYRLLHLAGFASALVALAVAYFFMEGYLGLEPCPLCILDRIVVAAAAGLFLLAALHDPTAVGQRLYAGANLLVCCVGIGLAARHVWLQNLPPEQVPDCTPGLDYLLSRFPLFEALGTVLNSAGECAEISWTFLALTIPQQTLLFFIALTLLSTAVLLKSSVRNAGVENAG